MQWGNVAVREDINTKIAKSQSLRHIHTMKIEAHTVFQNIKIMSSTVCSGILENYVQSTPDVKNHEIQKNLFFKTGFLSKEVYVNVLRSVNITSL